MMALARPGICADTQAPVDNPLSVVPARNWTGCYLGGHGGGLWTSKKDWTVRTPGGDFSGQSLGKHDANSCVAGVQAGCDYQVSGGLVVGIQGDNDWTNAVGRHDSAREFGVAYHSNTRSLASITGRVGYAWDRALAYVRGGGAWERDRYSASTIIVGTAYTASVTRQGWNIGIGAEYSFTDFVSGFVAFDQYGFGTRNIGFTPQLAGLRRGFIDITDNTRVVRAGFNIRFAGPPVPVVF